MLSSPSTFYCNVHAQSVFVYNIQTSPMTQFEISKMSKCFLNFIEEATGQDRFSMAITYIGWSSKHQICRIGSATPEHLAECNY